MGTLNRVTALIFALGAVTRKHFRGAYLVPSAAVYVAIPNIFYASVCCPPPTIFERNE